MTAISKIKKALENIMDIQDANACRVYKGMGWNGYGWYYEPFGRNAEYLGGSLNDALEILNSDADTL